MNDKTILITGVSSGIGRATAIDFDRRGARVFGTVTSEADGAALVAECSDRFVPLVLDLSDRPSITAAIATMTEHLGGRGLDGLVNNAGTIMSAPLEHLDLDRFEKLLAINVTGQIAVTQACLPLLRKVRGRVVLMSSVSGVSALPMIGPYCASKFAMEAVGDALRMELRPWGIHVSIIEPGSVRTAIMSHAHKSVGDSGYRAEYAEIVHGMQVGFERSATGGAPPEVVADRVRHALTARRPKARYLVGTVAYVRSYSRILPTRLRDWLTLRTLRKQASRHPDHDRGRTG